MPPRTRKASTANAAYDPEALAALVNKRWPGAMKFASDPTFEIKRVPTGILSLDILLDGGFALDRHTELFGGYNTGKTYVVFRTIAYNQKRGLNCAFVDAEGTFDPSFAASAGVDLKKLVLHEQETAEGVVDFVETLIRSRQFDIIGLDSIASLIPKSEVDNDMTAGSMGTEQAKLMSKALRKLTVANRSTALLYINQTREAVGASAFSKKSITSGGKAMGFYGATRLEIVRTDNIKKAGYRINPSTGDRVKIANRVGGHRVLVRVEKEKTGAAHQGAETTFVYDYDLGGIDPVEDLMYLGRQFGLIKKSANRWWIDGYKEDAVNGRARFKRWLRNEMAVAEELEENIRAAALESQDQVDTESDDDE